MKKKTGVITISSHVVRGSVGNRAAVHALETLGHPVWSVPTVILPWHPGHGGAAPILAEGTQFARLLDSLATAPWIDEIGAVLTGYFGTPEQVIATAQLIARMKERQPDLLYACDPVIGDAGRLYVPEERAAAIRERLVPLADIATPNRFELQWLTGMQNDAVEFEADALGPRFVLVTSAMGGTCTGNFLVSRERIMTATHGILHRAPNGSGDLTSALFLAHVLGGSDPAEALRHTTASVFEILERSVAAGADRLLLELASESLLRPEAEVEFEIFLRTSENQTLRLRPDSAVRHAQEHDSETGPAV